MIDFFSTSRDNAFLISENTPNISSKCETDKNSNGKQQRFYFDVGTYLTHLLLQNNIAALVDKSHIQAGGPKGIPSKHNPSPYGIKTKVEQEILYLSREV